jgi:RNA polymerase sigma-70 factor (ECF subfamily)
VNSSGKVMRIADLRIHINHAYTFARWLLVDPSEAENAVLEACVKVVRGETRYFSTGVSTRLLMLVRNECYARLPRNERNPEQSNPGPGAIGKEAIGSATTSATVNLDAKTEALKAALLRLPLELREVIVLRELHELPYKDISTIIGAPAHTVVSRLSRVRVMLMQAVFPEAGRAVPLDPCRVGGEI